MKNVYTFFTAVIVTANMFAQAPEKMSYQAVVRGADNELVASQAVGMQISILQGSTSGTAVYVETQTPSSNTNGLVSLEIGMGTIESGDFSTIDWGAGPYFIKTETDPKGGINYTITGTSQLMSVPYALHAKTAGNGLSPNQINEIAANTTKVGLTTEQAATLANTSGTNTGDQDISGIETNTNDIATLQTEQSTQNTAIAINSAKTGITGDQANEIEANTAKIALSTEQEATLANISGTNTGDQDISGIATNAGDITSLKTEQRIQNTAIALNTVKTGVTSDQADIIAATSNVNTGDQDISGIATNVGDIISLKTEQTIQNTAIALNTVKTGVTSDQADIIAATSNVNTGDQDISGIVTNTVAIAVNTSKTGITTAQSATITANTAKTGITTAQATAITNNSGKTGITTAQSSEIAANTLKTVITPAQATAITDNSAKTGITMAQSSEIAANTLKTVITPAQSETITNNEAAVTSLLTELEALKNRVAVLELEVGIYTPSVSVQDNLDNGISILDLLEHVTRDELYGKTYEGGLIFYVNETDGTGLVAAPTDQANIAIGTAAWGCYGTAIDGADTAGIGTGAQNTLDILAGCSETGTAAQLCADLVLNEKEDWFLPSKDELNEMYGNLKLNGFGGFATYYYWSSTEFNYLNARVQGFNNGYQNYFNKYGTYNVRAVRAF